MCGILGVFCNCQYVNTEKVIRGGQFLKSRGPDKTVTKVSKDGIYIFSRLAINGIDNGMQPMQHGNTMLMCNGEIYNHTALEKKYGLECKTGSDCEVILHLYLKLGFEKMVQELDGVYAIIIIDQDDVYLARDRFGVRPLYTGWTQTTPDSHLAASSLPNCLDGWCDNITEFPPYSTAHYNKLTRQITYQQREYQLATNRLTMTESVLIKKVRQTMINAVKKRLMSDRPIGCLLSGGLDSSIVTAILCNILGASNVRTYSIGMKGSTDLEKARVVAAYLGTDHHEVVFTPQEGIEIIPELIEQLGTKDITTIRASVGMYLLAKYISTTTQDRVIFSGEGSDEMFGGYLYFHNAPTPVDAENEALRLLHNIHYYDVLRADRTLSSNGLEMREPFLDQELCQLVLSLPAQYKVPVQGFEKYLLRKAFEDDLPQAIAWRRKEGFSDGVSSLKKPWYTHLQEYIDTRLGDEVVSAQYHSKEAMYYSLVFEKYFQTYRFNQPHWLPKWSLSQDPSGRLIGAFDENTPIPEYQCIEEDDVSDVDNE